MICTLNAYEAEGPTQTQSAAEVARDRGARKCDVVSREILLLFFDMM